MPTLSYLGPEGTFSHRAALLLARQGEILTACADFSEVFAHAAADPDGAAVVPFENTARGSIAEVVDLLTGGSPLEAVTCCAVPIRHCLASRDAGTPLRLIASKAEALAQCRATLRSRFPGIEVEAVASTAQAARMAAGDSSVGAVVGPELAHDAGLTVRAADIQDTVGNTTRFLRLEHPGAREQLLPATHALFYMTVKDRPGALIDMLTPLRGCDLTYIQSVPIPGQRWKYGFLAEVSTLAGGVTPEALIEALRPVTREVRCLGHYPLLGADAVTPALCLTLAELRALIAETDRRLGPCFAELTLPDGEADGPVVRSADIAEALDSTARAFIDGDAAARRAALEAFCAARLLPGQPLSECLLTLLEHRFRAALRVIGAKRAEALPGLAETIAARDADGVAAALLNAAVEQGVIARAADAVTAAGGSEEAARRVRALYRTLILPLSRRIQVLDALA